MRLDIPTGMDTTAQDLSPDAIVSLFRFDLSDGTIIRFTAQQTVTWLGNVYSGIPCALTQMQQDATGKASRPKFTFVNPEGIFTSVIQGGLLDNASLTRIRLLRADLEANVNASVTDQLFVAKILSLNKDLCSVEMRDIFDGHTFKLPARSYRPPEFPHVKI